MTKKSDVLSNGRLSLGEKVGYGVGDYGANLVFQSVLIFLIFYLTDVFGVAATTAGTIFLISKVWDGVSDPMVGYLSDRTYTRWGQKRPYLLFGAIPLGISFFLLFASPPIPDQYKAHYALILFLFVCTFYTIVNIPYGALAASMTIDSHERSRLSGFRTFFALMGTLTVAGATKPLVALFSTPEIGFRITAGIYGILVAVLTYITFFAVKEKVQSKREKKYTLRTILKVIGANPPFIILSFGMILHLVALGIVAAMVNYFFKYTMDNEPFATIAFLCIFVPAALALPLWVFVSKKLSKKAAFNLGMGLLALALFAIYFIRELNLLFLIPAFVAAGVGISTNFFSPWAMIPDTVEYGQWKTGFRREGVLYGFFFFGQKLASALAGFISGQGLGLIDFVPNEVQTIETLYGIRVLTTFIPIAFIILGIIIISFYPISEEKHKKLVSEIQKKRGY
jgi:GPH family glycoside/pentoside/hexuronide:cation symporter